MKLEAGAEYNINDDTAANLEKIKDNVTASAIFTEATEQGKDIRVKSAEEMNQEFIMKCLKMLLQMKKS